MKCMLIETTRLLTCACEKHATMEDNVLPLSLLLEPYKIDGLHLFMNICLGYFILMYS